MNIKFWKSKNVLITGGAGFIGSNLIPRLLSLEANIRVIDNLERGRLEYIEDYIDQIDFWRDDLIHPEVCEKCCDGMDVVFHLASKVGGIKYYLDYPSTVFDEMLFIDGFIWKAVRKHNIPYFLYASSAHVYPIELQGDPQSPLILEDQCYPANPELSYGWGKIIGEKRIEYALEEGCETRAAIVRIIGAYGPNQDIDLDKGSAIPVFIRRAIEYPRRTPFVVLGSGEETRSYCYIDDIINGLILSIEKLKDYPLIGPINLGREDRITISDLAQEIIEISKKDIKIQWDKSHPTVIWGQALDCSSAREVLDGWNPEVTIREGLELCYTHIQKRL